MLYSQGVDLNDLGVASRRGPSNANPREAWRKFAANFYLFNGTPSWLWLNYVFAKVFDIKVRLEPSTADHYFDVIGEKLATDAFRPRALFERFNIEVLGDHRVAGRYARPSSQNSEQRLEGAGHHCLSPGCRDRSRARAVQADALKRFAGDHG